MTLTRTRNKMPDYIHNVLTERKLMDAYHERPDYQQNDYIGSLCVTRAKREETKAKRLAHTCPGCRCRGMLEELEGGKLYMNMKWNPGR
jgi:Bacteriocin-protection, YdeI or OmpD-Associated